ncbi:chemotaxis protein CheW [Piscinibacter sp. HJYY11]|uniref:chemotaxis protein CheW n=1 Tax=Piscinibacter sp. HJYY11 TaxID=2801333 RepID=UPI00191F42EF|nr:chemotaxis protein CheW [Piscinibacter sp. HJYY11]MBL0727258.1 chemotaxis protein CheW [Piscinibacter sp. HJYY11]
MSEVITAPLPGAISSRSKPTGAKVADTLVDAAIREFLAFKLGSEEYGIDLLRVQEIRSYEEPTRIANAPEFMKGVLNLRGVIVPVVDMRLRFNLPEARYDGLTVLIVLNLHSRIVGMVVDSVSDVITLSGDQMRAVPEFASNVPTDHLLAIGAIDDRMLILVDIVKFMSSADMGLLNH